MKKVLIVDDERMILNLVKFDLEDRGYEVVAAESGEDALETLTSYKPDLVILDVMMNGISGLETCQKIRETEKALKILILSGRNTEGDIQAGYDAGADIYLTKPFRASELLNQVEKALAET